VGRTPLFLLFFGGNPLGINIMTHPLIPQIIDIASPVAAQLGLELVSAVLHTNQRPPSLRVDVRNLNDDTGLDDCERMSRALEIALDEADIIPHAYSLEVSSPGIARQLTTDREFTAFRGFGIKVTTNEPFEGKTIWQGQLVRREESILQLTLKGKQINIPLNLVARVDLDGE
jgi:ribosome maturation factor RimP